MNNCRPRSHPRMDPTRRQRPLRLASTRCTHTACPLSPKGAERERTEARSRSAQCMVDARSMHAVALAFEQRPGSMDVFVFEATHQKAKLHALVVQRGRRRREVNIVGPLKGDATARHSGKQTVRPAGRSARCKTRRECKRQRAARDVRRLGVQQRTSTTRAAQTTVRAYLYRHCQPSR